MDFVLVHGGFHGGWCWKKVTPLLRAAGYEVFTPTLTGLGERQHLLNPQVGLDTHIQDILNLLLYEELNDVILVGHSYAGMVITGVAEKAKDRLAQLVYLDAVAPRDGQSFIDISDPELRGAIQEKTTDGWKVSPKADEVLAWLGIRDADDLEWMSPRITPQSLKSLDQPVRFNESALQGFPKTFIYSTEPSSGTAHARMAHRARSEGWECYELPTGHDSMITAPNKLAELLLVVAGKRRGRHRPT